MTALDQYVRLEAPGRWRERPDSAWREVLVSFGNASLVISSFSEDPLTHWSLAAVERLEEGPDRVLYAPDRSGDEVLEITDPQMVSAIAEASRMARIRARPAPRQPRLRAAALVALVLVVAGAGITWGPDLMRRQALALVTQEQASLIAEGVRGRLGARACALPEGQRSLRRLVAATMPGAMVEIRAWDAPPLSVLTDDTILLSRRVVEQAGSAEVVAGWITLGALWGVDRTPLSRWIEQLPPLEVARFLLSGDLQRADMNGIAALAREGSGVPDATALAAVAETLATRGIDAAPFLEEAARRWPDRVVSPPAQADSSPVMPRDQNWIALQEICAG
ncbi:hypothetical protein HMH01_12185 [Halovulum dunhuangense]|uniref:Uncharacterized protein n=1 Tax=Halovulum dunhuangense TaxID=1505036 RepID=A0A849L4C5_9RHOB|nr:hypothetical protein [Halovulum dunhuangense]NNU81195.1 hypothetical protein [Halovulum dunhuangense]